jgi:hypothetical protein
MLEQVVRLVKRGGRQRLLKGVCRFLHVVLVPVSGVRDRVGTFEEGDGIKMKNQDAPSSASRL